MPDFLKFPALTLVKTPEGPTLGSNIINLRLSKCLSRQMLADRAEIACSVLAAYERDEITKKSPIILLKIVRAMDIPETCLLQGLKDYIPGTGIVDFLYPTITFGARLQNLRMKKQMQQRELAKLLNVSRETIRRYENNQSKPSRQKIKRIVEILGR